MALLIAGRIVGLSRAQRLADLRAKLLASLLAFLDGELSEADLVALLRTDKALSIDVLIELFENMRGEGQERLAALAMRTGLVAHIYRILSKGRMRDRLIAAECLLWFPSPETVAALRKAIGDREVEVSLAAAASLIELSSDLPLEELLAGRLDRFKASRRLEGLLGRVTRQHPERLVRIAEDEMRTDRLRAAALEALAQAGASTFLDRVVVLAASAAIDVRAGVARYVGAIGHPGSAGGIRTLLSDPAWQVRVRAADAAGQLGAAELGEMLVALIDDENWWVRLRSAEALARLGEAGIATLKAVVAREASPTSAQAAALVLAERRSKA